MGCCWALHRIHLQGGGIAGEADACWGPGQWSEGAREAGEPQGRPRRVLGQLGCESLLMFFLPRAGDRIWGTEPPSRANTIERAEVQHVCGLVDVRCGKSRGMTPGTQHGVCQSRDMGLFAKAMLGHTWSHLQAGHDQVMHSVRVAPGSLLGPRDMTAAGTGGQTHQTDRHSLDTRMNRTSQVR